MAHLEVAVQHLQQERDANDLRLMESEWYGPVACKIPRRAKDVEECSLWILRAMHSYPVAVFSVGMENTEVYTKARPYVYSQQSFYLRNQWDNNPQGTYWYGDCKVLGALDDLSEIEVEQLLTNHFERRAETNVIDEDAHTFMTPFTPQEHDIIQECVVRRFVMPLDEAMSGEGRELKDFGMRLGPDIELGTAFDGYRSWCNKVFGLPDEQVRLAFQAMHLLEAH